MNILSLKNYILKIAVGHGASELTAFDRALIAAGISSYNLIKVSSILPPDCVRQNNITLSSGLLLPSAFTAINSNKIGETISAAVAIGIPREHGNVGVIMEHSAISCQMKVESVARQLAEQAMADRNIKVLEIISSSIECTVETNEIHCAFATVSMW